MKLNWTKFVPLANSSWSDLEKVVFVHDYIEQNFEFDLNGEIYDRLRIFNSEKRRMPGIRTQLFMP